MDSRGYLYFSTSGVGATIDRLAAIMKMLQNEVYNSPQILISLSSNDHLVDDNWVYHGVLDNAVSIYLDDCSSGFAVINNIIVDGWYGLHHCGRDNLYDNNVMIRMNGAAWHVGNWGANHAGNQATLHERLDDVPYQSAPWLKYPHLANILDDEPAVLKYNTVSIIS